MKKEWVWLRLGLGAALIVALVVGVGILGAQTPQPRPTLPGGQAGPSSYPSAGAMTPRAVGPLNEAYDGIGVVSMWLKSGHVKLEQDESGLLDQVKDLYRHAYQAYKEGCDRRAAELAMAANDGARGLLYVLSAESPKVEGIPTPPSMFEQGASYGTGTGRTPAGTGTPTLPPPGGGTTPPGGRAPGAAPAAQPGGVEAGQGAAMGVREIIREIRDRVGDIPANTTQGPGKQFLDASRHALERAEKCADERHYRRAFHFALAADSWSRVPEHLRRGETGIQPAPGGLDRQGRPGVNPTAPGTPPTGRPPSPGR
jgi:hypothetical protein